MNVIDNSKVREQLSMADPHGVSEQVCDNNAVSSCKRVRRKIIDLPCVDQGKDGIYAFFALLKKV